MPPTVSVAAFVFGIVLLLAALIGKELKLVTVELPALGPGRRVVLGSLGLALTLFGMLEGELPELRLPVSTSGSPNSVVMAGVGPVSATGAPSAASGESVLPCLADVSETDLVILSMEPTRRTDRKWSTEQPRAGVLAMQFEDDSGIRGGVRFHTLASATGIDIVAVYDATCQPITSYGNVSRPDQPKNSPYDYDTMRYQFGDAVYTADIAYGEGDGKLSIRAQQTGL